MVVPDKQNGSLNVLPELDVFVSDVRLDIYEYILIILLYRPVPLHLLLGAKGAGGRKGTWDSVQSHPRHRERDGTECARTRHHLCTVPGWGIRDTGHPVG